MSQNFDFIATSVPVNRSAATVLRTGEHYDRQNGNNHAGHSKTPLPVQPFKGPTSEDRTGERFGEFTVVGYAARNVSRWVCRCSCGAYEYRKSRAIRNTENGFDRCIECRDTAYLRRHAKYLATLRFQTEP